MVVGREERLPWAWLKQALLWHLAHDWDLDGWDVRSMPCSVSSFRLRVGSMNLGSRRWGLLRLKVRVDHKKLSRLRTLEASCLQNMQRRRAFTKMHKPLNRIRIRLFSQAVHHEPKTPSPNLPTLNPKTRNRTLIEARETIHTTSQNRDSAACNTSDHICHCSCKSWHTLLCFDRGVS